MGKLYAANAKEVSRARAVLIRARNCLTFIIPCMYSIEMFALMGQTLQSKVMRQQGCERNKSFMRGFIHFAAKGQVFTIIFNFPYKYV